MPSFTPMHNRPLAWLSGALLAIALTLAAPSSALAEQGGFSLEDMIAVTPSEKPFGATVDALRREVAAAGWTMVNENNMAGVLSARGFTLHPVMIFDVCSGQHSVPILRQDALRPLTAFMPCRVSVYQTSDEQVFIARMNVAALAPMLPPDAAEVMQQAAREIDEIVTRAVSR